MNERIKQLAEQARSYVADAIELGFPRDQVDDIRDEKFAELIVRECLDQADNIREGCEVDGEDEQALGADWVGLAIARHFGVEE
jgi:hypothetical protein